MSEVTSILLITACGEDRLDELQAWCREKWDSTLRKISGEEGGDKFMQCDVWAAGMNHRNFERPDFIEKVKSMRWDTPEQVQLFLKGEHEEKFSLAWEGVYTFP